MNRSSDRSVGLVVLPTFIEWSDGEIFLQTVEQWPVQILVVVGHDDHGA